jgi:hypothetical protein
MKNSRAKSRFLVDVLTQLLQLMDLRWKYYRHMRNGWKHDYDYINNPLLSGTPTNKTNGTFAVSTNDEPGGLSLWFGILGLYTGLESCETKVHKIYIYMENCSTRIQTINMFINLPFGVKCEYVYIYVCIYLYNITNKNRSWVGNEHVR